MSRTYDKIDSKKVECAKPEKSLEIEVERGYHMDRKVYFVLSCENRKVENSQNYCTALQALCPYTNQSLVKKDFF